MTNRPTLTSHPILDSSVGGKGDVAVATTSVPTVDAAPRPNLFRERALVAYRRASVAGEPVRIAPIWATWLVAVTGLLVLGALVAACFANVDVTSVGRGILQANGAPQVLAAQVAGTVVSVSVRPGDKVVVGEEIARLESAATAAALLEATRKLKLASRSVRYFREQTKPLYSARISQQQAQIQALKRRAASESKSAYRFTQKSNKVLSMSREGVASIFQSTDADEQAEEASRNVLRAQEDGAVAREAVAAISVDVATEEWRLTVQEEEARAQRDSLKFALDAAVVRSPIDGIMGSIAIRPGDTVQVGGFLGRVVSAGVPRSVVVYLPERDRAFVDRGSRVRVEVDQLPFWEFGALRGMVARVSTDIASERDLRDTLGDQVRIQEPMYRIDVSLDPDKKYANLSQRLRPESLADVRFTLRTRRLISVLFEPLQRWVH
jgi:membrane fusion protein